MSDETFVRGAAIGLAQANALAAPIGAVILFAAGQWLIAAIFAASSVLGLLVWHSYGWPPLPWSRKRRRAGGSRG